ncbi:MAG: PEP-CTERM sorting domain-containing protein [Phycisphaeraceae bacterium]|nr:PEP-CTERM sorting domain-containing protein [Phycisphaeraceae bacterium]
MRRFVFCLAVLAGAAASASAELSFVSAVGNLSDGISSNIGNVQSMRSSGGLRDITAGDTYGAALLGQSPAGAAFVTNAAGRITSFVYDNAASFHGTLVGSAATVNMAELTIPTGPNSVRVIVGAFTTDSSNLWISGLNIGGQAMNQGRLDVGAGAFTDGLLWDNLPGAITSVSITNALFIDGSLVATSAPLTNGRVLPEMGSLVVWNGVVNSGVDETQMIFDITYVPAPGSVALLGLGGLLAARRRR